MNYEKVFEISLNSNDIVNTFYSFLFIEGVILLIGLALLIYVFRNRNSLSFSAWKKPLLLIFGAILGFFFTLSDKPSHQYLTQYQAGEYSIIEGKVNVLRRQPQTGHAPGDSIKIGEIPFVIDYFISTPTYKTTISHGGVLKHGVYAKVFYSDGKILRIDLKK